MPVPGTVIGAVTGFVTGTGEFAGFVGGANETGGVVEGTRFVAPGLVEGTVMIAGEVDAGFVYCRVLLVAKN